jgi:type II secretory pathway pseudopilin PulG
MKFPNRKNRFRIKGLTLIELVISMSLIVIVLSAILPQFRVMFRSLDLRQASAETLANSRVFTDHIRRTLSQAINVTAVSASADTNGYLEFTGSDGNAYRCDRSANDIRFGLTGRQEIVAGPVSSLQFTGYAYSDLTAPTTTGALIDYVKVDAVFTDSTGCGQNESVSFSVLMPRDSASGEAVLINYFDSYSTGQVNARTTKWKGNTSLNNAEIVSVGGKCARMVQKSASASACYCILNSNATIAEGQARTFYMRFRINDSQTGQSLGFTSNDTPPLDGSGLSQFNAQWGFAGQSVTARDAGVTRTLAYSGTGVQVSLAIDTWYNIWVVVDNANDTIRIYLKEACYAATGSDLLVNKDLLTQSTFGFRNNTTETLDRFYWYAGTGNGAENQRVYIDNLFISDGINLAIPLWIGTVELP